MNSHLEQEELEKTPEGKEFIRKKDQQFHERIQGKEDRSKFRTQTEQQKNFKERNKVIFCCLLVEVGFLPIVFEGIKRASQ